MMTRVVAIATVFATASVTVRRNGNSSVKASIPKPKPLLYMVGLACRQDDRELEVAAMCTVR